MNKPVYTTEGKPIGEINLPDDIFAIEPNEHAMYLAVVAYLANKRQGTHSTKVRSEVRGGGKKPWRQKGRGTARSGSTRSPIWIGGGTIFGPRPHSYEMKINKKVKRLAKKSALSLRCEEDNLIIIEDFHLAEIKTKNLFNILQNFDLDFEKTLIILPENNYNIQLSSRNIPGLVVKPSQSFTTYDVLNHTKILLFKSSIDKLVELFNGAGLYVSNDSLSGDEVDINTIEENNKEVIESNDENEE